MGPYQYKARVARLRLKGGDVRDFGERALGQGAYGDDVMQLQARAWAAPAMACHILQQRRRPACRACSRAPKRRRACCVRHARDAPYHPNRTPPAHGCCPRAPPALTSTKPPPALALPSPLNHPLSVPPTHLPTTQAYLAEQGYFNAADGLSGYFGAVTGEALQAWQRDQGLRVTGVFNDECKWAVLRAQVGASGCPLWAVLRAWVHGCSWRRRWLKEAAAWACGWAWAWGRLG